MSKVSVYVPTHNRLELLKRAMLSVQSQSYEDWELIVVDDASTDGTWDYLQSLTDERIKVLRNDQAKGACASRNRAIEMASGEFVTGLDDDDEFTPNRLERLLEVYDDRYAFICSGFYWITEQNSKPTLCQSRAISLSAQLHVNHATNQVLVKRDRMLAVGGFDESFVALQDYDCFTRLIKAYGPAYRLGEPLQNIYVEHGGARISNQQRTLTGFKQFLDKHQADMTPAHRRSQQFLRKQRTRERTGLIEWLSSLRGGLVMMKTKHFLVTNFLERNHKV